jgi:hypothetical protein
MTEHTNPVEALLDALDRGDAWAVSDAAGEIKRRADGGFLLPPLPDRYVKVA